MVRLGDNSLNINTDNDPLFQFQYGAIRSQYNDFTVDDWFAVSIPVWCD